MKSQIRISAISIPSNFAEGAGRNSKNDLRFTKNFYMILEILTPEKKLFEGNVYGVQLPGISGLFEVLDKHAPLVSALGKGNLKVLKTKNDFENFNIQGGFVEVMNNKTTILIEGATQA